MTNVGSLSLRFKSVRLLGFQTLVAILLIAVSVASYGQDLPIVADKAKISARAETQEDQWLPRPWIPRPYLSGYFSLANASYSPLSVSLVGGLTIENRRLFIMADAGGDNAKKDTSKSGHSIYLKALVFPRFPRRWYFGGGVMWGKYEGSDYSKQSGHPVFGGGKDYFGHRLSMRAQALYVLPGNDHSNALQGPEFTVWLPSPATKNHLFMVIKEGIYEYHQSAFPGNPGTGHRGVMNTFDTGIFVRF